MDWSKDQARSVLLGNQWFSGRTGVYNQNFNGQLNQSDIKNLN
jgi:hypothetical protein